MKFEDLRLADPLLKAVADQDYLSPSPIQEKAIPPVLEGRDLIGCAQTGTGKTAAFALPILQRLSRKPSGGQRSIRALILTPTRELALQIHESFEAYGKYLPLGCAVIFGGVSQQPQVEALRKGVDILVATPGRLNDLIGQGFVSLKHLEIFVLDEADRMLDMGFVHDVKKVISHLPDRRQTLLFSATMPREIVQLAQTILTNPVRVEVTPVSSTVDAIQQSVYFVDKSNKKHLLVHLLKDPTVRSALVFTRTKHGADRVVKDLGRAGIQGMAIHGNKSQNARQNALSSFKNGSVRVLVATDIAARGIDVEELSHVINYDLPNVPETYVHRIGRTGRAGCSGIAISFCDSEEKAYLKDIEKLIRKTVPVVEEHPYPMEVFQAVTQAERPVPEPRQEKSAPKGRKTERPIETKGAEASPHRKTGQRDTFGKDGERKKKPVQLVQKERTVQPDRKQKQKQNPSSHPKADGKVQTVVMPAENQPKASPPVAPLQAGRTQQEGSRSKRAKAGSPEPAIQKPRQIRPFQSRSEGSNREFLHKKGI